MAELECIAKTYKRAVVKSCSDAGCSLKLTGLKDYLILKGEAVYDGKPVCDCIIFVRQKQLTAGVVELKSKTVDVSQVTRQLTGGLEIVFEALGKCGNEPVRCYVVVLAKKWRTSEFKIIKNRKIKFRGKNYNILPKRCGTSFSDIIPIYPSARGRV